MTALSSSTIRTLSSITYTFRKINLIKFSYFILILDITTDIFIKLYQIIFFYFYMCYKLVIVNRCSFNKKQERSLFPALSGRSSP